MCFKMVFKRVSTIKRKEGFAKRKEGFALNILLTIYRAKRAKQKNLNFVSIHPYHLSNTCLYGLKKNIAPQIKFSRYPMARPHAATM